jgi:hypothetical protein
MFVGSYLLKYSPTRFYSRSVCSSLSPSRILSNYGIGCIAVECLVPFVCVKCPSLSYVFTSTSSTQTTAYPAILSRERERDRDWDSSSDSAHIRTTTERCLYSSIYTCAYYPHLLTLASFRSLVPVLCLAAGDVHAGCSNFVHRLQGLGACKCDEGRIPASIPRLINFAYTCRQSCGQPMHRGIMSSFLREFSSSPHLFGTIRPT